MVKCMCRHVYKHIYMDICVCHLVYEHMRVIIGRHRPVYKHTSLAMIVDVTKHLCKFYMINPLNYVVILLNSCVSIGCSA